MKLNWLPLLFLSACTTEITHGVFPNLHETSDGKIAMIYTKDTEDGNALILNDNEIASGADWVVNWADFPSAVEYAPGKLAAHYLVMTDPENFAYDIQIITSDDAGQTWNPPLTPHTDQTLTEHGFVSMAGVNGDLLVVWLDGRNYAHGIDRMEIRGALISNNTIKHEYLIDDSVCSCCGTEIISNSDKIFLVYRDRYPGEMRDMSLVTFDLQSLSWNAPKRIHQDGWSIAACPVNGPAIDADSTNLSIAWYTELEGTPTIYFTTSTDEGATFSEPQTVNEGYPLGRVDLELLNCSTYISYMETDGSENAGIYLRHHNGTTFNSPTQIGSTSSSRASGFPKIKNAPGNPDALILSYTKVYNSEKAPEIIVEKVGI